MERQVDRRAGLTLIEVIVALAIFAIGASALVASFSLITRLNREANVEVDYSRVVRSLVDRTKADWELADSWLRREVGSVEFPAFVDARSEGRCQGEIADSADFDLVRIVTITCAEGDPIHEQSYVVEFGAP